MSKVINLFVITILVSLIDFGENAATMETLHASLKIVRDVCQPKFEISDELIAEIQKGAFPDDKKAKCYSHCVFETTGLMHKNKINYEAGLKQIEILLPEELKDNYRKGLNNCKDIANGIKDKCDAGYALIKCIEKNNPQFLFP